MSVEVKCSDFLAGNDHMYAGKARRKKIALIRVDVTNGDSATATVRLGSSSLMAGGKAHQPEEPAVIVRKLGEFTWDFLLYSVIDFHPVTAVLDTAVFLSGPMYKRRLRRQLNLVVNDDLTVPPGESRTAVVGFRPVAKTPDRVTTILRNGDTELPVECVVETGRKTTA